MPANPKRSGNPAVRARATAKPKGTYSLAKYRQEATGEPFRLEIDDDRVIEIPRPTGEAIMVLAEKYAGLDPANPQYGPREQLKDLLGDSYDEIMPILGAEDFGVMIAFLGDLTEFFGLGEALASLG